jgi:replicative DNA helicase
MLSGRGGGKALSLDTPLPKVDGWTTMGDVQVGDQLFDERVQPCRVTYVTAVFLGRSCFRVVLDDGSSLVTDAEHEWITSDLRGFVCRFMSTRGIRRSVHGRHREPIHYLHVRGRTPRAIVAVEEVPSVPVRCISVDSPSRLYLAGESYIPTHNTRAGAEWVRSLAEANPGCRIALVGRTRLTCATSW